jgi:Ca2+-binding EF-hand superfamily protein
MGSLDEKMLFTFEMFDFDNDGYITAEDIRIMLSYMQFNRNVEAKNVQSALEARMMSPARGSRQGSR